MRNNPYIILLNSLLRRLLVDSKFSSTQLYLKFGSSVLAFLIRPKVHLEELLNLRLFALLKLFIYTIQKAFFKALFNFFFLVKRRIFFVRELPLLKFLDSCKIKKP
jgi:hypothetical protein